MRATSFTRRDLKLPVDRKRAAGYTLGELARETSVSLEQEREREREWDKGRANLAAAEGKKVRRLIGDGIEILSRVRSHAPRISHLGPLIHARRPPTRRHAYRREIVARASVSRVSLGVYPCFPAVRVCARMLRESAVRRR